MDLSEMNRIRKKIRTELNPNKKEKEKEKKTQYFIAKEMKRKIQMALP